MVTLSVASLANLPNLQRPRQSMFSFSLVALVVAVAVASFIAGGFVTLRNPTWVANAAGKLQAAGKLVGADAVKVVSRVKGW